MTVSSRLRIRCSGLASFASFRVYCMSQNAVAPAMPYLSLLTTALDPTGTKANSNVAGLPAQLDALIESAVRAKLDRLTDSRFALDLHASVDQRVAQLADARADDIHARQAAVETKLAAILEQVRTFARP